MVEEISKSKPREETASWSEASAAAQAPRLLGSEIILREL